MPESYLFTCIGTRGDVQPFLALAIALKSHPNTHAVTLAAHPEFENFVKSFSIDFHPLTPNITDVLQSEDGKKAMKASPLKALENLESTFGPVFEQWLGGILDGVNKYKPTVLVLSLQALMCGALGIIEKDKIKCVLINPAPFWPTKAFAPPTLGVGSNLGIFNRFSWNIQFKMMKYVNGNLENRSRSKYGLPIATIGFDKYITMHKVPVIHAYTKFLLPKPSDWPDNVHVVGALNIQNEKQSDLPADLSKFLEKSDQYTIIYFGVGSMLGSLFEPSVAVKILNQVLGASVNIVGKHAQVKFIIHTVVGGPKKAVPLAISKEHENNIFSLNVPVAHSKLFPYLSLVIHHGGAGTMQSTLLAGKASLILPCGPNSDQPFWASLLEKKGLAVKDGFPIKNISSRKLEKIISRAIIKGELKEINERCGNVKKRSEEEEDPISTCLKLITAV